LLLKELAGEDPAAYINIMRLSQTMFDDLLKTVTPAITKINTIPSKTKFDITLRYLSTLFASCLYAPLMFLIFVFRSSSFRIRKPISVNSIRKLGHIVPTRICSHVIFIGRIP